MLTLNTFNFFKLQKIIAKYSLLQHSLPRKQA